MFNWFPKTSNDLNTLNRWKTSPTNFEPNQPIDRSWYVDSHQVSLGKDEGDVFDRAARLLFGYRFYPPGVMHHTSTFEQEDRLLHMGDRILQRIHLIPGVLDVLTLTYIRNTMVEYHRKGFTYATTERHLEMGEWTAVITRRPGEDVKLMLYSISKPGPHMPLWAKPLARMYQVRAHRLGIEHFRRLVQT